MTTRSTTPPLLRLAIPSPLRRPFQYLPPAELDASAVAGLQPGVRVRVPFGRRNVTGILLDIEQGEADVEASRLRAAHEVLDDSPLLPAHLLQLCCWAASYYQHPVGEALHSLLPVALRQGAEARYRPHHSDPEEAAPQDSSAAEPALSDEQSEAIRAVSESTGSFRAFLLDGITGSGKTEVYLQLIRQALERGQQALLLVP